MKDIITPPFTEGQQELIKMTEQLANGRKICDVDDIDDDIKDIKEMLSETIAKIEMKKKTNFARITSSPEALAEFMEKHASCGHDCPITDKNLCKYKYENCKEAWLEWLKQENDTE